MHYNTISAVIPRPEECGDCDLSGLNFQEFVYLAVQVTLHLPFWAQCAEYLGLFKLPAIGTVLLLPTGVVVCAVVLRDS